MIDINDEVKRIASEYSKPKEGEALAREIYNLVSKTLDKSLQSYQSQELEQGIENVVDGILADDALFFCHFDKSEVEKLKTWSDDKQQAHYALREKVKSQLLTLFNSHLKGEGQKVAGEIFAYLEQKWGWTGIPLSEFKLEGSDYHDFKAKYSQER